MRLLSLFLLATSLSAAPIILSLSSPTPPTAAGYSYAIEFQLSDGDGAPGTAYATIAMMSLTNIDLQLGDAQTAGPVSGQLDGSGVTLEDDPFVAVFPFVTSYYLPFLHNPPGGAFAFVLWIDAQSLADPLNGTEPLSIYLYETSPTFESVRTTGSGALVQIELSSAGQVLTTFPSDASGGSYSFEVVTPSNGVPEPGSWWLVGTAIAAYGWRRRR